MSTVPNHLRRFPSPTYAGIASTSRTTVFDRVVCGVDGSLTSLEAARQAGRLLGYAGSLELVSAVDASAAAGLGLARETVTGLLEGEARVALEQTLEIAGAAATRIAYGAPAAVLLDAALEGRATLLAVGSQGRRRLTGILLGSVSTAVVHRAPCSVLVARPARDPAGFPRSIVVGADGSRNSLLAVAAARELADRHRARLRTIVADGVGEPEIEAVGTTADRVEVDGRDALTALLDASREADLVVVGSRGLRGLRALGSVSERLAHSADASVLVVRDSADGT